MNDHAPHAPPALIAHRGDAANYPENTLAAIGAAFSRGARHVEIDIQLTADRVPVLLHDATLARTGTCADDITTLASATLDQLSVGEAARFGDRFESERIATLASFGTLLRGAPGRHAFIEIKPHSIDAFGIDATLDAIVPEVQDLRCTVISFDAALLVAARDRGVASIGWIVRAIDDASAAETRRLQPQFIFADHRLHRDEAPLWPDVDWAFYEIEDPEYGLALARAGATYIETMKIGTFLDHPGYAGAGAA